MAGDKVQKKGQNETDRVAFELLKSLVSNNAIYNGNAAQDMIVVKTANRLATVFVEERERLASVATTRSRQADDSSPARE